MEATQAPSIIVLGVGNTLMQDDGAGVWAVRAVQEAYHLPSSVLLVEAGVMSPAVLADLNEVKHLLLIDAVDRKGPPGSLYRLTPQDVSSRSGPALSAHDVGVCEILAMAQLVGRLPQTIILGIQPLATTTIGLELTLPLQKALPSVVEAIVAELEALGVELATKKPENVTPTVAFQSAHA